MEAEAVCQVPSEADRPQNEYCHYVNVGKSMSSE